MTPPEPPANDDQRVGESGASAALANAPVEVLRPLAARAAACAGTPVGLITFLDADSLWIKAATGMEEGQISRHSAFCAWAVHSLEVLWVEDALLDIRYADNPLVLSAPFIRHYAGAPILLPEGFALGVICVLDYEPRAFQPEVAPMLKQLADEVATLLA